MWAARPVRDMLAEAGIDEREAVKRLTRWIKALPKERRAFPCAHEGETTQSYIRRYYVENALRYVGGPRGYTYSGEWPC